MAQLASRFGAEAALWEVVGLCHDLDLPLTESDLSQHGPLAAQWLAGRLPPEATQAIAAHDHPPQSRHAARRDVLQSGWDKMPITQR